MKRVKMLRTRERDPLLGDATYELSDVEADALIANGHAKVAERVVEPAQAVRTRAGARDDTPNDPNKPPAKSAKTKAKEQKAADIAAKKTEKAGQKKSPAWPPNTHVSKKRPASKRKK